MLMTQSADHTQTALQFFGFRYPPFADTFEIDQPYQSTTDRSITHRTLALLRQGRSVAIHGDAGSGKSMLAKAICSQLDAKEYRVAHIPYGGMKPTVILRDLCDELDIDTAGRKSCLSRLAADFNAATDKPFPVIVVDEAHEMQRLSFIDLCALLNNTRRRTAAAAIILIGQPSLKKLLELDIYAPVRTRLTCIFTTTALSLEDAREFILFRLKKAHADPALFDGEALNCLALDSKGNRRMLMNLAALCLEEAARRNEKIVTAEIVNAVSSECL
jgi:general secretion pathway protein A